VTAHNFSGARGDHKTGNILVAPQWGEGSFTGEVEGEKVGERQGQQPNTNVRPIGPRGCETSSQKKRGEKLFGKLEKPLTEPSGEYNFTAQNRGRNLENPGMSKVGKKRQGGAVEGEGVWKGVRLPISGLIPSDWEETRRKSETIGTRDDPIFNSQKTRLGGPPLGAA